MLGISGVADGVTSIRSATALGTGAGRQEPPRRNDIYSSGGLSLMYLACNFCTSLGSPHSAPMGNLPLWRQMKETKSRIRKPRSQKWSSVLRSGFSIGLGQVLFESKSPSFFSKSRVGTGGGFPYSSGPLYFFLWGRGSTKDVTLSRRSSGYIPTPCMLHLGQGSGFTEHDGT